jgi:SNF2 family DNA or RNA helicase
LPSTLQAELRPYQEDGYQWAMRLASRPRRCLADDMGLGKTLQALAVMLARGPAGRPCVVIAPTSVCGNWLAEIQRFAPSLNPHLRRGRARRAARPKPGRWMW